VLHPHLLRNTELVNRFRREARLHAQIIHPNIVTLLSVYESSRHLALVVEMVHGQTLKKYLRDNRKPDLGEVLRISHGILSGLSAAHELNLVHRDLKPANVLIGDDGEIKLMDFGLAKSQTCVEDITKSGATVGSFRYMAPEQILNKPVDERTDLYAFGILLYQMSTGQLPFDITGSGGEFEIMEKQVRQNPVPPQEINPDIPKSLAEAIMSLLAKEADDRPKDCAAVRKLLESLASSANVKIRSIANGPAEKTFSSTRTVSNALSGTSQRILSMITSHDTSKRNAVKGEKTDKPPGSPQPPKNQSPRLPLLLLLTVLIAGGLFLIGELPRNSDPQIQQVQPSPPPIQPKQSSDTVVAAPEKAKAPATKPKITYTATPVRLQSTKPPARSITLSNKHKLVRSDSSTVQTNQPHEFTGGKHVFFSDLESYLWKDKLRTQKNGWIRLYLEDTVQLSKVSIHQASVGERDFRGGDIQFEVQKPRGEWVTLLSLKDQDIDKPITISEPRDALKEVIGIRMRFRSPEPITIGPIELLP